MEEKKRRRRKKKEKEIISPKLLEIRTRGEFFMVFMGVILGCVTLVASAIYMITGILIPGLSPLTLAAFLALCGIWIHMKNLRDSFSFWLEAIFLIAGLLNMISGLLQIAVYLNH